jgi:tRNA uridine 5-carboxymethylaminomethyl modification enzyme
MFSDYYDVIVAGAGHAGCEAALAAARTGAKTLLLTINLDHIAQMSCNPAVGGIAKGHLVREIDAMGGAMGEITDASSIQFRMLNASKGPAVWSPRSQCDKVFYQRSMKHRLEMFPGLHVRQALVCAFVVEGGKITGIITQLGECVRGKAFVICSGTFLSGKLHYGLQSFPGGRAGDPPSNELSAALSSQLGLRLGRLKTGTPPRVLSKSVDFDKMTPQPSETREEYFSFFPDFDPIPKVPRRDMPCHMVYSTEETAAAVNRNLDKSPMYRGNIKGIGTRYCPSFEDKVVRFPHHGKHLLYLEPEGGQTGEYYINGISTSLPPEVQTEMLKTIPGLENVIISRYAYAIEYDFVFPDQITRGLAVKTWPNLFLAGQINGTSGYEEAAGQGLLAGLNAARSAAGLDSAEILRNEAYIGVMIDDLVTKDIIEPYRLFTSRAERRLTLRQDNADLRLCEKAYKLGLLPEGKHAAFQRYKTLLDTALAAAKTVRADGRTIWDALKDFKGEFPSAKAADFHFIPELAGAPPSMSGRVLRQLAVQAHYDGYMKREESAALRLLDLEKWQIPASFDYGVIPGLCNESRMKLKKILPSTLSQASRIDGVTPAEIALLQVFLHRSGVSGSSVME